MEKQKFNPVSIVQTTSSVTQQIQTAQVIGPTVVSATQTLNAEDVAERSSDDSSTSSEEVKLEDLMKSPFDESVAELPISEQATQGRQSDSSESSEKVKLAEIMKSPFDDSDASSSQ
jgi:sulfite reductase alpha subunit-like flavoprotein